MKIIAQKLVLRLKVFLGAAPSQQQWNVTGQHEERGMGINPKKKRVSHIIHHTASLEHGFDKVNSVGKPGEIISLSISSRKFPSS